MKIDMKLLTKAKIEFDDDGISYQLHFMTRARDGKRPFADMTLELYSQVEADQFYPGKIYEIEIKDPAQLIKEPKISKIN